MLLFYPCAHLISGLRSLMVAARFIVHFPSLTRVVLEQNQYEPMSTLFVEAVANIVKANCSKKGS